MIKRILTYACIIVMLTTCLTGCGGKKGTPPVLTFDGTDITIGSSSPSALSGQGFALTFIGGYELTGTMPGKSWMSDLLIAGKDDERYGYFYIYNPERVETSCLNATIYQVSFYIHSEEYADWTKNNILVNGINFYGMNIDDVKAAMAPLTTSSSGPYLVFNDGDYTYLITLGADGLVEEVEIELNFSKSFDQI